MCGIVGIASTVPREEKELLAAMCETLRHRGPDDAGAWWSADGRAGLAQRRLAIIDLSPGGHQPMSEATGRVWITVNGEIYNYRELKEELKRAGHAFRTESDTEVVLEAYREWGDGFLTRLNGMFALALVDADRRRVLLARDRAGEKPLFWSLSRGRLLFASELKALFAHPDFPRALDPEALDHYFTYGYVPGPLCMIAGARKLPAATALSFDLESGATKEWKYWRLPAPAGPGRAAERDLLEELEAKLLESVRLRLIADVPVGILLSGGIDSSLVTAMAARVAGTVRTFTIAFPAEPAFDEGPHARLVADHFSTRHEELVAEAASVELLPLLARQYDEPLADSSMVPTYLVSRLIRPHAKVALGGDGGDELFAGYPHYGWLEQMAPVRERVPSPVRRFVAGAAARVLPVGVPGRNYAIGVGWEEAGGIARINRIFDVLDRERLLLPGARPRAGVESPEDFKARLCDPAQSALQQATRADFRTYLPDDLLVKVDRASMLASLEVRAPWLDPALVDFAFGRVPDHLRSTAAEQKILPRRLAARLLPANLSLRRKQGFSLPLKKWFRGDWGSFIGQVVREAEPNLFNRRQCVALLAGQRRGFSNTARLFALAMFELWRREYKPSLPGAGAAAG